MKIYLMLALSLALSAEVVIPKNLQATAQSALAGSVADQKIMGGYFFKKRNFINMLSEENALESIRWYKMAAEKGDVESMLSIARFYSQGWGVKQSRNETIFWLTKAAEHGDSEAITNLSRAGIDVSKFPGGVVIASTVGRPVTGNKPATELSTERPSWTKFTPYDGNRAELLSIIAAHKGKINSIVWSDDGKKILTVGQDLNINLIDVQSKQVEMSLMIPSVSQGVAFLKSFVGNETSGFYQAIFGPTNETVVSATQGPEIVLWDLNAQKELRRLKGHDNPVTGLFLTKDKSKLISSGRSEVILWNTTTWEIEKKWSIDALTTRDSLIKATNFIVTAAFAEEANKLAVMTTDKVLVLDLTSFSKVSEFYQVENKMKGGFGSIGISDDGREIALGAVSSYYVKVVDPINGSTLVDVSYTNSQPVRTVYRVKFTKDGKYLMTAASDGTVRYWAIDGMSGTIKKEDCFFGFHVNKADDSLGASSIGVSPDGQTLATGGYDKKILIWNMPQ